MAENQKKLEPKNTHKATKNAQLLRGKSEGIKPQKPSSSPFYRMGSTARAVDGSEVAKASQERHYSSLQAYPQRQRRKGRNHKKQRAPSEFLERVLDIARVTTVVKGGRRFSFSAYVIIGDKKGRVGFGHGKANEVPDAIKKAIRNAQNHLVNVPLVASTVPHESTGKFLASKVLIKPAPKGKGIIASGTMRAVLELAGYSDIYAKSYGSRSKMNTAKATFVALAKMRNAQTIAELRNLDLETMTLKRG